MSLTVQVGRSGWDHVAGAHKNWLGTGDVFRGNGQKPLYPPDYARIRLGAISADRLAGFGSCLVLRVLSVFVPNFTNSYYFFLASANIHPQESFSPLTPVFLSVVDIFDSVKDFILCCIEPHYNLTAELMVDVLYLSPGFPARSSGIELWISRRVREAEGGDEFADLIGDKPYSAARAQAMDGMQKAVAKNMEATLGVPVFRVSRKIRTDAFDEVYRQLKPKGVTVRS